MTNFKQDTGSRKPDRILRLIVGLVVSILLFVSGCDSFSSDESGPVSATQEESEGLGNPKFRDVFRIQDSLGTAIMWHDEIVGVATTISESGEATIVVLTKTPVDSWAPAKKTIVPPEAGGHRVNVIVTGEITAPISAQGAGALVGAQEFSRPVPIGVSTGPPSGATGTIGARVTNGSSVFALSNNHVFASINSGSFGDPIIQPGSVDGGTESQHTIGQLTDFEMIDFSGQCVNTIDAAIAETMLNQLQNETLVEGYGVPWSSSLQATTGMDVQKFGRTSGLTFGSVIALNATVQVSYGSAGVACFTDQIIVSPGEFSEGGDSGSLVVASSSDTDIDTRPVGLLFAGSPTISVANEIDNVLSRFNVSIDGRGSVDPNLGQSGDNGNQGSGNNGDNGNQGSGNDGDNGNLGDGNNGEDDGWEATPQNTTEVYIEVKDTSGQLVGSVELCAFSSSSNKTCADSKSTVEDGSANWVAEVDGHGPVLMVGLNQTTKYIILNNKSTNALYYYWTYGDQDVFADYIVTNTITGEGYFANVTTNGGSAEWAVVTTKISNVVVSSPRVGESDIDIDWEAKWIGPTSFSYPTFILSSSRVLLIDGSTSTLSTFESQSGGTGNLVWTPQQEYSSIKIRVEDKQFGESAESSLFNVDNPLSFSISGPSSLDAGVEGTWTTSVSGGTSPYSYDWDYMLICTSQAIESRVEQCNTWNQGTGGTGTSWSHSLSGAQFDLKIRLTVSDSDNPHYTKKVYKTVDIIDV